MWKMSFPQPSFGDIEPSFDEGNPITARDVLGAMIDILALDGIPISSRAKGIIARQAKELLADGFDPYVVLQASVAAYCRSQPSIVYLLAMEIATAEAGKHISPREWRERVNSYKAAQKGPSISQQLIKTVYDRKRAGR